MKTMAAGTRGWDRGRGMVGLLVVTVTDGRVYLEVVCDNASASKERLCIIDQEPFTITYLWKADFKAILIRAD